MLDTYVDLPCMNIFRFSDLARCPTDEQLYITGKQTLQKKSQDQREFPVRCFINKQEHKTIKDYCIFAQHTVHLLMTVRTAVESGSKDKHHLADRVKRSRR